MTKEVVSNMIKKRFDWLDLIRVTACFMVILTHVRFAFDLKTDTVNQIYNVLVRPCVPLFIMISGALLLPLKYDTPTFFKKRLTRVVVPALIWSIIYVFLPTGGEINFGGLENVLTSSDMTPHVKSLLMIPINFTWSTVHFWFIYTLIGLYLFLPIISPWIEKTTKRGLEFFLLGWGMTTVLFYAKIWFPQLHGACDWNQFDMLYNFGGYLGYFILGHYLLKYNTMSLAKSLLIGISLIFVGGFFTFKGMIFSLHHADQMSWIAAEGQKVEFFINCLSINVVVMTVGMFIIMQKIELTGIWQKVIAELSKFSYGIFLVHYILCVWLANLAGKSSAGGFRTLWEQPLRAIAVFVLSYIIVKLLSLLPKSKYLIG